MSGNSKTALSKLQREEFLRSKGFEFLRWGKGDHAIWENAELKELARHNKVECPPNLLSNPHQNPWETTLSEGPAVGTWNRIAKHAEWSQEKITEIKGAAAVEERRRQIKQDFLDAKKDICDWKHETKHRLKAGLDAKPAPTSYHQLQTLKARL